MTLRRYFRRGVFLLQKHSKEGDARGGPGLPGRRGIWRRKSVGNLVKLSDFSGAARSNRKHDNILTGINRVYYRLCSVNPGSGKRE